LIEENSPASYIFPQSFYFDLLPANEWFRNNLLSLNLNKTTYLQFQTKSSQKFDLNIALLNNQIANSTNIKFLGLIFEETLSWKRHINQILLKLSLVCYAIKVITPFMSEVL